MAVFGGWRITRAGIIFIVGILILGGLVTGGIFLVKNHGEAVRRDQAVKVAEQNLKDNSEIAVQPVKSDDSKNTDTSNQPATPPANGSTNELPVTGIDDLRFAGQAIILAILAFSTTAYIVSRRASNQL
ncbi:hypothetical protein H7100_02205 [Candidatus Saccharibacteria bacterium]|nr:hypothetical protein [Candidatus Saccharibacteria bacterium]